MCGGMYFYLWANTPSILLHILLHLGDTQYIVWSTRSDKGLFALAGGKKMKNKISSLAHFRGKNKKKKRKNRQIPYDLSTF